MEAFICNKNVKLETERLILRSWKETDLNDFNEYASVPGVGEMAGWPAHESIEVSKGILDSWLSGESFQLAIVYKENGKVIGSIGLHKSWADDMEEYKNLKTKEVGYVLSKDYWGKGLMVEAVKEIIRFVFDDFGLDALTVGYFSHNTQSKRVIEKCGFTFVKEMQKESKQLNKVFDGYDYIVFRN